MDSTLHGHPLRRNGIYLLVQLASRSNELPPSLFLAGVDIGLGRDPVAHGGFADIFCAKYHGQQVALKRARVCNLDKDMFYQVSCALGSLCLLTYLCTSKAFCKEALVWRQLCHPNVLRFLGIDRYTFSSTNALCMVSPWMAQGTVIAYLRSSAYYPAQDRHRLVSELRPLTFLCWSVLPQLGEIAAGIYYLHSQKIVHGDIKDVSPIPSALKRYLIPDR